MPNRGTAEPGAPSQPASRLASRRRARITEVALVGTVLAPVLGHPAVRQSFGELDRRRRSALALMTAATLAGHFTRGTRLFPFVTWDMYTAPVTGDPVIIEYDAVLEDGTTVPLSPSRFLGPQSAARLMEALRRQVVRLTALEPGTAEAEDLRREHELALLAMALRFARDRAVGRVAGVRVNTRTVSVADGSKGAVSLLWEIAVA